jgi:hypothetical protein
MTGDGTGLRFELEERTTLAFDVVEQFGRRESRIESKPQASLGEGRLQLLDQTPQQRKQALSCGGIPRTEKGGHQMVLRVALEADEPSRGR